MGLFGPPDIDKLLEVGDSRRLIKALGHSDTKIRRGAATALTELGMEATEWGLRDIGSRAIEPLAKLLDDPDKGVRENAAAALCVFGDRRGLDPLFERLENSTEENGLSRSKIMRVFQNVPDPRARELVLPHLLAEMKETRHHTIPRDLAKVGGDRVRQAFMEILQDPKYFVGNEILFREAVVDALGILEDHQVIGPMLDALAIDSNQKFGGSNIANRVVNALCTLVNTDDIDTLLIRLDNPCLAVVGAAVELLGWVRDARAVEPLIEVLKKTPGWVSDGREVRAKAAKALGKIGDSRAIKALKEVCVHERGGVRERAEEALKKCLEKAKHD
jgi:HEAT repeat protein